MGNGASDSQLDLLLFAGPAAQAEVLSSLTCSLTNPLVASHHDLILSSVLLPPAAPVLSSSDLVSELRTRELKSSGMKRVNRQQLCDLKYFTAPSVKLYIVCFITYFVLVLSDILDLKLDQVNSTNLLLMF